MGRWYAIPLFCTLTFSPSDLSWARSEAGELPGGFVYVEDVVPGIKVDLRYCSDRNFVGRPVNGYAKPTCILTKAAAEALGRAQKNLSRFGLGLKIFDAYRPQMAVDDFVRWGKDLGDTKSPRRLKPTAIVGTPLRGRDLRRLAGAHQ